MNSRTLAVILSQDKISLEAALALEPGSARIEVQSLLQAVLQVNRAWLLAHPEEFLDSQQYAHYISWFERRLKGEPLAYILGQREFYGLNFKVTHATLIPRPDTELLVELALTRIPEGGAVLDLGTGSGAIALSLAHARADAKITAVDISEAALAVARENAQHLHLRNLRLLCCDWFESLTGENYHLIVSNPPYIAAKDAHLLQGDLRFEPHSALASGADGLDAIRQITAQAKTYLKPGGWLLLEHGYDQAARVRELLLLAGFSEVGSEKDLAGIERVSGGRNA